jgi:hypothetical protein
MKREFYSSKKMNRIFNPIALLMIAGLLFTHLVNAQTPTYNKVGTGTLGNAIPLGSASTKTQLLYTPTDFNTLPINGNITKIYFRNSLSPQSSTFTNFQVSFIQNNDAAFVNSNYYPGLTPAMSVASITITGNTTAPGWFEILLPTPFPYDNTKSLIVEIQYSSRTGTALLTTTTTSTGNKRLSGVFNASTGSAQNTWNDFGMEVQPFVPCVDPPTAGTSTATPAGPFCPGIFTTYFNLTGNSTGSSQTYQWFSDPSQFGTYSTSISAVSSTSSANTVPFTTLWYRCAVTCGATTNYSTPVQVVVNQPLAGGTYTIGPAGDFTTITNAINAMGCGISGPVIFNVTAGTYTEQMILPAIVGTSSTNTITFNGNGCTLQFGPTVSTARAIIQLLGTDYTTINNFNITATAGTYGWGVHLMGGADNNTISNCNIRIDSSSTSNANFFGIVISGSTSLATSTGINGNFNTFTGNTISGGYNSIILTGSTTSGNENLNNTISNNILKNSYSNAIELVGQKNLIVSVNDISRPTRTNSTTAAGIFLSTGCLNSLIEKNRIHNFFDAMLTSASTCYGLYSSATGTAANRNVFQNNLVYSMNGNANIYGMYNTSGAFSKYYHNTISLDDAASTTTGFTYGIYQQGAVAGLEYINNIVSITRNGTGLKRCINFVSTTTSNISNNNAFYFNPPAGTNNFLGQYVSTTYATLANWKTANSNLWDQQSVSANPGFVSPGTADFTPTSNVVNNIGINVGVTTDILNQSRSASTPDPGCYEFTVPATDLGVTNIVSPNTGGCYTNSETIVVTIKNFGLNTIDFSLDPVTVTADVTGQITASSSAILNSGSLAPGASQNVTLSPAFNGTANGSYTINAYTTVASDGNSSNDASQINFTVGVISGSIYPSVTNLCASQMPPALTLIGNYGGAVQWQESLVSSSGPWNNVGTNSSTYTPPSLSQTTYYQAVISCNANSATASAATITFNNPQLISTTPGTRCGYGTVTLGATLSGASTANWYTNASGGIPVATGATFTTPNINSTTNYYVSATTGGFSANTGMPAALSTASSGSGINSGLVFDVSSPFVLNSVVVYPVSPSSSSGTITIDIINSAGVVLHTASANVTGHPISSIVPVTIPLNFFVAPGTNYKMRAILSVSISGLLFEPSAFAPAGNYGYPYTVPGVLSILTSTVTAAPANTARNDLYNYFYNWSITTGCESARTLVTATVTPSPDLDVTATFGAVCTGGSTDISASSVNDPDYTYSWTSAPAGFTATGAGPHTVSPSVTTSYYVVATDNSGNANQGCASLDSITIVSGGALASGTVSTNVSEHCVSGSSNLTVTGASGGFVQWQKSTVSATGPWTNVGTGATTLATGVLTQTTYYQVVVSCQTNSLTSNVQTIIVNNPQLTSTNGDSRCGSGPVTLTATSAGSTINWYSSSSGGAPLASGTSYSPNVTGTTTFYVAASMSGGGTTGLGLANRVGTTSNSGYNDVGLMFDAIQPFTLQSVAVYPVATSPSGNVNAVIALKNSAGTILQSQSISIPTAVSPGVKTVVGLNFNVPAGTGYRLVFTSASGGGITGFIRETSGFTYPYALPGFASITSAYTGGPSSSFYYYFYDWQIVTFCEGIRVPVVANVSTPPSIAVTPTQTTCSNVSKTLTVTSPNDPNYTYTWMPGNLSGASVTVNPAATTTYTVNAIDNTAGANAGCTNSNTVLVNVNPAPTVPVITPSSPILCENDTVMLKALNALPHTGTLGTQASQNTASTYPAPYTMPFGGQRMQMLVRASELNASGFSAGSQLSAIQFPVISMGSNWGSVVTSCQNFQVSIGATNLASIASFQTGLTQVVAPANFTPTVGYNNTHNFNSSFTWDGISNIIIETTFSNFTAGSTNNNVIQYNSPTSYQSTIVYRQDNVTAAAAAIATAVSFTANARVDFKLLGTAGSPVTWSPLADLFADENLTIPYTGGFADSVYSKPAVTKTYTVNTSFGSCSASNTVTVTVNVVPQVTITPAGTTSYCPGNTVTLNASTDPSYTNYAWTPGGPSGAGATSFTVGGATNTTTGYTVTATGAGGCTSYETIPVTVYDTVSPAITVIGSSNLCSGQTSSDLQGDIFGATGPAQDYAWSTSETTSLITVSAGGTYSLVTTDIHGCVTHNSQVITESTTPPAPIISPAGIINICSSDGGATYSSVTLTCTNYSSDLLWSTSETTTSILVDYPDNFNVTYTDPSGCFAVSNQVTTNAYLASDAPTSASSDASFNSVCLGNTVTLSVNGGALGDGADWHWYEGSCNGTPRGIGSSVILTPSTAGTHVYYVRAEGVCNTTACVSISILVSTAPPQYGASITTAPISGCNGTSAVMSGPTVNGASYYNWSCSQGGVLFNGVPGTLQTATPSVNVTFVTLPPAGASGYSVCVFAGNACGQSLAFCRFVRARVSQPSVISGNVIGCANTNNIYSVGAVTGADTYTWTITGNAGINGGGNTITTASPSVTVNFLPGWTTGTLSVYSSLNCGFNSTARTLAISSTPGVPGAITGASYVCAGSSASFSVPAVNGAASYNWTTTVPGAVVTPNMNSASILFPAVIPGGSSVCVTAVSSCGNASAPRCKGIANGIPGVPGNISGPVNGQCGQSGVSYSITPVSQATSYLWTATNGATVSGPNNLSAVSINFPSTFVTCTLSVIASNSCGSSSARTLIVNGTPAQAGTITGNQSVCNGAVEPYSTGGSTGATSYNWVVPAGATILNTPPYTANILVMWGPTGGNVTVTAGNDCGTSAIRSLPVSVTCRVSQVSKSADEVAPELYPNPANDHATLKFTTDEVSNYTMNIYDAIGDKIITREVTSTKGLNVIELDLSSYSKGIYFIQLRNKDNNYQLQLSVQ